MTSGGICGDNVTWRLEGTMLTISGTGEMFDSGELSEEFSNRESIECIIVESGVTKIGNFAFGFCDNLRRVELPDSVTEIGMSAFVFCGKLKDLKLSANVVTINRSAFCGCWNLSRIKLPAGLVEIGDNAFINCAGLREVEIPVSVKTIGDKAFENCENLKEVTIPFGVKHIGENVFNNCANLKTIYCAAGCGFEDILRAGNRATIVQTVAPVADGLHWQLDGDTLTIIDADKLKSLSHDENAPWYDKRESIKKIIITS